MDVTTARNRIIATQAQRRAGRFDISKLAANRATSPIISISYY
jgi:hypothetical protein